MLEFNKISDTMFSLSEDGGEARNILEPYMAESVGDWVLIRSQIRPITMRPARYNEIIINGVKYDTPSETVRALSFIGNFNFGGGASSSQTLAFQYKNVFITENGLETILPDWNFDALSQVNVNVNVGVDLSKSFLFFDFDGTVLYSYTKDEIRDLTELPEPPKHLFLTNNGWTHTLEQIKSSIYPLHIGAQYNTTDGKTYAFVTLTVASGKALPLCFNVVGTATIKIDWGDGQTQNATASSTITHTYANTGSYIITLERISGTGSYELGRGAIATNFIGVGILAYQQTLNKLYIGANASISYGAFANCQALKSIVIPSSITRLTDLMCYNCYSLNSVVIPASVTHINGYAFQFCYSLRSVVIPQTIINIALNSFQYCYSISSIIIPDSVNNLGPYSFGSCVIKRYIFTRETPPSLVMPSFENIISTCKIYVPDARVNAYKTALNWTTYANYIYPISEIL